MSKYCSKYLSHKKLNAIEFQCNMKSIQLNKSFKSMNQSQSMSEPMVPLLYLCASSIPACTGQGGVYPSMHWAEGCVSQHALERGVSARGGGLSAHGGRGCLSSGCLPRGVSVQLGVCPDGVSAWGCLPMEGVSARGGVVYLGGVCLWGLSACGALSAQGRGRCLHSGVSAQGVVCPVSGRHPPWTE